MIMNTHFSTVRFPQLGRLCWLWLCLFLTLVGQATVRESVLPNGLTVLIKPVHEAPVVTVDVWYRVGSRDERASLTGISHMLEHMTYKGTRQYDREMMRTLTRRNGAIDNGATFYDYTHYYTTIARDRLDLALKLEASRMRYAMLRQADLETERTVVRSELEGRENNPGSLLFQEVMATAFKAHPYAQPVIGWPDDLARMSAADLRTYYTTYYQPANATLVIVGDIEPAQALTQVRRYFGGIARGALPIRRIPQEPVQRGERRVIVRRQGQVPIVMVGWHVPALTHPDAPALMVLEQLLGAGRLSRLYERIVETKLGVSAWSNTLLLRDSGLFFLGGATSPGQDPAPVQAALIEVVDGLTLTPPTAEELLRAKRQLRASLIYAQDSVTQQAEQLGYYATVADDWRFQDRLPALLDQVSAEDLVRVARTYCTVDNCTIGLFQPVASTALTPAPIPVSAKPASTAPPPAAPTPTTSAPALSATQPARERIVLPNGVVLIIQENHATPTVAIRATLKAGRAYEADEKAGVADLVANLLDHGTTTADARALAAKLEGVGAEITTGTGWETVGVTGKALSADVEVLLGTLADILRRPTFPAAEVEKMRAQMLANVAMERDRPSANAYRALYRATLPVGHPYRLAALDDIQRGLTSLTSADARAFHQAHYTPRATLLAVVGDVSAAQIRTLVARYFGDWAGPAAVALRFPTMTPVSATRITLPIRDKSEASIMVGHQATLRRASTDYYAAQIMNLLLGGGGALDSRLGTQIRDKHGLAYTVSSAFHASTGAGPWYASLGVNPANIDKACALLLAEVTRFRSDGVSAQEVSDAIAFLTGAHAIALETNSAMASELLDAEYFALGLDYPERVTARYAQVTPAAVLAAAQKYLHPDQLVFVIAGSIPAVAQEK
jgi:zinc protease